MPPIKHQPYPSDKPHFKGLTVKQQNFTKEIVRQVKEDGEVNGSKAIQLTYPGANSPDAMASENLSKHSIRSALLGEFQRQGITKERITNVLQDGLSADRAIVLDKQIEYVKDHGTRLKYVQEINRVTDAYPDQQITVDKRVANINIDVKMDPAKLQERLNDNLANINSLQDEYS